jgi:hypothetical protein
LPEGRKVQRRHGRGSMPAAARCVQHVPRLRFSCNGRAAETTVALIVTA